MALNPQNLGTSATLTFDDEFNILQLWNGTYGWDTTGGGQWTGRVTAAGTLPYNNELQWYVDPTYQGLPDPFAINNGVLDITAAPADPSIQPSIGGQQYTSGMISTAHSFSQTYGYFEMRAELPAGQGLWPAFWLLPADGSWPPELDVMEMLGNEPTRVYQTAHSGASGTHTMVSSSAVVVDTSAGFHTYGVDWEPDFITWYVDGQQVFQTATPADMNQPMYMIANLAVGGDWPGSPDGNTTFPATMQIDYIRAYAAKQSLFTLPESGSSTKSITGTSKADKLTGTAGNDFLDGKGGGDKMTGGAGDDTYAVRDSRDQVTENFGGGIDTVQSYIGSYALPANVEHLVLKGSSAQTGTGNQLNNRLVSNDFGSTLNGGIGDDILVAGRGPDTLTGGAGRDCIVFQSLPSSAGHITDFTSGQDVLDLRALFAGAGYSGSDPIRDHVLVLANNSAGGTDISFDADGWGAGNSALVTTVDHTLASSMHAQVDWWYT